MIAISVSLISNGKVEGGSKRYAMDCDAGPPLKGGKGWAPAGKN